MRRYVLIAGGILLLTAVAAIVLGWPQRQTGSDTGISPIAVSVSTPLPMPPPDETVVEVVVGRGRAVRLCAGTAARFINCSGGPVILTASDASFSSGVLGPGEEYAFIFPAAGTVSVTVLSPAGETIMEPYRIEVVQCGEEESP